MAAHASTRTQDRRTFTPRKPRASARKIGAACAIGALALTTLASPAGANQGCGELSFSFDGTRLLNDGISNIAGPFAADIPAGTYTVTLIASDQHDEQVDVPSQDGEQYHVVLDSGYVSPASTDIPDDANTSTTVISGQVIAQSNAISVRHGGADGINSVDVVCVGFTPEPQVVVEPAPEPDASPIVEPEAPEPPPTQDIGDPVELTRPPAPLVDPPAAPDTPPTAPPAVEPVADTQVEGVTITADQVPLLAITGPSTEAFAMVIAGLTLIAIGGFLVRRERRFSEG